MSTGGSGGRGPRGARALVTSVAAGHPGGPSLPAWPRGMAWRPYGVDLWRVAIASAVLSVNAALQVTQLPLLLPTVCDAVSASTIYWAADASAQTIGDLKERKRQKKGPPPRAEADRAASAGGSALGSLQWMDGIRQSARYAVLGLADGAMSHHWYIWVDQVVLDTGPFAVVKKVALDQVLLTPLWATGFITILAVLEGKGPRGIFASLKADFVSVCYSSNLFWVVANAINYWLVPLEHRVMGFCVATFIFTVYLSFIRDGSDDGGAGDALQDKAVPLADPSVNAVVIASAD